jgi:hypothetical protein
MKKNELKKVLKPLIKECIKECIFEEGVLSNIITEVVQGLETRSIVTESVVVKKKGSSNTESIRKKEEKYEKKRQERIKKLNESMNFGPGIDVFENTKQIPETSSPGGALAGVAPADAGVDISEIVGMSGGKWKHLI